ncbi:DNA-directed RNA polymerase subunit delta [Mycoplasmopsis pullorum]|uniref:HTH HARE-type domain-containing protein n=1 Tax=Mycoplasmopsis pullorum TaxID=48003 RepID=A0A1L4FRH9_9BACT|nr:hypothetical protein [Mycoplasmopsis pullorum]APJ38189.1 hypothetical protein BLA55_00600 [Mycoplasmopsis pullorum]TNK82104.1 hypothetical protein C4M94_02025 [Mycoplasmopsis pullorum]TNK83212.1 hypothetical protein C4M80_01085 [Mycoplasmopsis pullorum]TNK83811.1 hypothetical protein C4M93_01045 [Mycoplasmopsis pullorum]TNK84348.1 hypothetical protein C4M81_02520 [Mycoplasmopsis pullorum]
MKTMLDIAIDVVVNGTQKSYKFDTIFDEIERQLKDYWEENLVTEQQSYEKLRVKKIGELYRLLTVDGRFIRNNDETWSSSGK